jgi:hypothetical protein
MDSSNNLSIGRTAKPGAAFRKVKRKQLHRACT